jgi:hypothetical protein
LARAAAAAAAYLRLKQRCKVEGLSVEGSLFPAVLVRLSHVRASAAPDCSCVSPWSVTLRGTTTACRRANHQARPPRHTPHSRTHRKWMQLQGGARLALRRAPALIRAAGALSSRRWAAGVPLAGARREHASGQRGERADGGSRRGGERLVVRAARGPRPWVGRTCVECTRRWRLKLSELAWFEFHALPVPERCGQCRTFRKLVNERGTSSTPPSRTHRVSVSSAVPREQQSVANPQARERMRRGGVQGSGWRTTRSRRARRQSSAAFATRSWRRSESWSGRKTRWRARRSSGPSGHPR